MEITDQEVGRIARLARLEITPQEKELYRGQLAKILEHMAELKTLNTKDVPPTSGALELGPVLREDVPRPFEEPQRLLDQAPERDGPCFKVPKVLD